jgi:hypothetical protein
VDATFSIIQKIRNMEDTQIRPSSNNEILDLKRQIEEQDHVIAEFQQIAMLSHDKISFLSSLILDILKKNVKLGAKIEPETEEILNLYVEDYQNELDFELDDEL